MTTDTIYYKEKLLNDSDLFQEFIDLVADGTPLAQIARRFNITRDIVRTIVNKFQLVRGDRRFRLSAEEAENCAEAIKSGLTFKDLGTNLKVNHEKIRKELIRHGYNLEELFKYRSAHRYDGKQFNAWSVIDGTHRRISDTPDFAITCKCVCGSVKDVRLSNLLSGASASCGCEGYAYRTNRPWQNHDTGEVVLTSAELEQRTGIHKLQLYRDHRRNLPVIDDDGNQWDPIDGTEKRAGKHRGISWQNLTTYQVVESCRELSGLIKMDVHTIRMMTRDSDDRRSFVDRQGNIWRTIC